MIKVNTKDYFLKGVGKEKRREVSLFKIGRDGEGKVISKTHVISFNKKKQDSIIKKYVKALAPKKVIKAKKTNKPEKVEEIKKEDEK